MNFFVLVHQREEKKEKKNRKEKETHRATHVLYSFALFAPHSESSAIDHLRHHLQISVLIFFRQFFDITLFFKIGTMAITILPPVVEDVDIPQTDIDPDSMSVDSDGGVDLVGASRPGKRTRMGGNKVGAGIVTPGEVVTNDPQWMRLVLALFMKYRRHC